MVTSSSAGIQQSFDIDGTNGDLPEPGCYAPGAAKVVFSGTVITSGISQSASQGRTNIEADVRSISPVGEKGTIEVEVYGWEERFKGAPISFVIDAKTGHGSFCFT